MVNLKNLNRVILNYDKTEMKFKRDGDPDEPLTVKRFLCEVFAGKFWHLPSVMNRGGAGAPLFKTEYEQAEAVEKIWGAGNEVELSRPLKEDIVKIVQQSASLFMATQITKALFPDKDDADKTGA